MIDGSSNTIGQGGRRTRATASVKAEQLATGADAIHAADAAQCDSPGRLRDRANRARRDRARPRCIGCIQHPRSDAGADVRVRLAKEVQGARLALRVHPDKMCHDPDSSICADAHRAFLYVQHAYEMLTDVEVQRDEIELAQLQQRDFVERVIAAACICALAVAKKCARTSLNAIESVRTARGISTQSARSRTERINRVSGWVCTRLSLPCVRWLLWRMCIWW